MRKLFLILLSTVMMSSVYGQAEAFIGEVRLVAFNYAPQGWYECSGQILPIAQNQALFALIGCTYGGDCRTTFALPDLRGRVPVGSGQGTNLPNVMQGQVFGNTTATLSVSNSSVGVSSQKVCTTGDDVSNINVPVVQNAIPFNVSQPSLGMKYIICYQGLWPSRP